MMNNFITIALQFSRSPEFNVSEMRRLNGGVVLNETAATVSLADIY